jgi:hypothetical protein
MPRLKGLLSESSVHALSTVADYIDRAIKLLEPTPKETT